MMHRLGGLMKAVVLILPVKESHVEEMNHNWIIAIGKLPVVEV